MNKTLLIVGIIITSLSLIAITIFTISNFILKRIKKSEHIEITEEQKRNLDELHKAKIAEADLIYIINIDNYIGNSTRSEIKWAV